MAARSRPVSTWAMSRSTRGSACGTSISVVHVCLTSTMPSSRAASAGNSDTRSGVAVNRMLITSSWPRSLRSSTALTSSRVASSTCSRSSASTCVAPRMARTAMYHSSFVYGVRIAGACSSLRKGPPAPHPLASSRRAPAGGPSETDELLERAELLLGQLADRARAHALQLDRADRGAGEPGDRQADVRQQPPHDVLAALVQHDLDHGLAGVGVDDAERVHLHRAVVQLHSVAQAAGQVARHRARHLGEVGLAHLVGRVRQAVGQLAVVGEEQQPLGVLVEAADVHQPLGQVADHVADGRAGPVVAHRRDHARGLVHGVGDAVLADLDPHAVDGDLVRGGVHPHALHGDLRAVHADPAGLDHVLADPPRADAGAGQHLLQPLALAVLGLGGGPVAGVRRGQLHVLGPAMAAVGRALVVLGQVVRYSVHRRPVSHRSAVRSPARAPEHPTGAPKVSKVVVRGGSSVGAWGQARVTADSGWPPGSRPSSPSGVRRTASRRCCCCTRGQPPAAPSPRCCRCSPRACAPWPPTCAGTAMPTSRRPGTTSAPLPRTWWRSSTPWTCLAPCWSGRPAGATSRSRSPSAHRIAWRVSSSPERPATCAAGRRSPRSSNSSATRWTPRGCGGSSPASPTWSGCPPGTSTSWSTTPSACPPRSGWRRSTG